MTASTSSLIQTRLHRALLPVNLVPFLLNPAGIAVLVIASGENGSFVMGAVIIGLVQIMAVID